MTTLSENTTAEIHDILLTSLETAQANATVSDDPEQEPCECYADSATAVLNRITNDIAALLEKPHGDDTCCEHPVRSAVDAIIFDICRVGFRIVNPAPTEPDASAPASTDRAQREHSRRNVESH